MAIFDRLAHPARLALSALKTGCLSHLILANVVQLCPTYGPSMLPTLAVDGDVIVADMTARRGRHIAVGDVVLYKIPILPSHTGAKRVVAMPGDYVSLGTPGLAGEERMIQVPDGHCWIVGDNLPASRDSRHFGPLPLALIQGKVVAKVLPWSERHLIANSLQPVDRHDARS